MKDWSLKKFWKRAIKVVISYTKFWGTYIRDQIWKLKREFNLTWLRVRFCYKRFANIKEMFQGDLTVKLQRGLTIIDYGDPGCNCHASAKNAKGECAYNGRCNQSILVYEVTCKKTGKKYIGSNQQKFKKIIEGHYNDVRLWFRKGFRTDSFARHFSRFFTAKPTAGQIRSICDFKIIQSVILFSFSKNIRSYSCKLCMAEKTWLIKGKKQNSLINVDPEIYGPCRHESKFPRFLPD